MADSVDGIPSIIRSESAFSAVTVSTDSNDRLKALKDKSRKRRLLLAKQFGLSNPDNLGDVLKPKASLDVEVRGRKQACSTDVARAVKLVYDESDTTIDTSQGLSWEAPTIPMNEEAEEEGEIYTDSSAFLKGTQSANPHNDYCQHFVDTGERPQNFIHDVGLANRFEEYPKLRELIRLKNELVQKTNTPPMYLKCDLETFDFANLDTEFDVILIEPPLEEYQRTQGVTKDTYWSWDMIGALDIERIAGMRSFIWIWCGQHDGLDAARWCLKRWGYRRCEDICWIKTNIKNPGHNKNLEPKAIFQRTKEHCLMGIKGTVRRSIDGDFIHANVDIDLIIDEEKYGTDEKPEEIFHIIEHFCLGRRRLHLFGRDSTIRPGWLTIGPELTSSNFDRETYNAFFDDDIGVTTRCTDDIERLRPKTPPLKNESERGNNRRGGRGRGDAGRGGALGGGRGQGRGGRGRGGFRGRGAHRGGAQ